MESWLLVVEANCTDESRVAEFDDWYDNIHIPDILSGSPGCKSATRYVRKYPAPGKPKYLAVYEFETDDIEKTLEAHAKNVETKYAAGRKSPFAEIVSRRFCKVR